MPNGVVDVRSTIVPKNLMQHFSGALITLQASFENVEWVYYQCRGHSTDEASHCFYERVGLRVAIRHEYLGHIKAVKAMDLNLEEPLR